MRFSRNRTAHSYARLWTGLYGLGQSSNTTYTIIKHRYPGGVAVTQWKVVNGGTYDNAYDYVKESKGGRTTGLTWSELYNLFDTRPVGDAYSGAKLYIDGTNNSVQYLGYSTTNYITADMKNKGFNLITSDGVVTIDPYLYYKSGVFINDLVASANKSKAERDSGLYKNCPPFGNITIEQANALISQGQNSQCIKDASQLQSCPSGSIPVSSSGICSEGTWQNLPNRSDCKQCVPNAITPPPSPPPSNQPPSTPATCPPGWDVISNVTCGPGQVRLLSRSTGCATCYPPTPSNAPNYPGLPPYPGSSPFPPYSVHPAPCPTGFLQPDLAVDPCPQGEVKVQDQASGCIGCQPASNCFSPGQQPVPCYSPNFLANRGNYVCCVSSATPPGVPAPQAQIPTVSAPPVQQPAATQASAFSSPVAKGAVITSLAAAGLLIYNYMK